MRKTQTCCWKNFFFLTLTPRTFFLVNLCQLFSRKVGKEQVLCLMNLISCKKQLIYSINNAIGRTFYIFILFMIMKWWSGMFYLHWFSCKNSVNSPWRQQEMVEFARSFLFILIGNPLFGHLSPPNRRTSLKHLIFTCCNTARTSHKSRTQAKKKLMRKWPKGIRPTKRYIVLILWASMFIYSAFCGSFKKSASFAGFNAGLRGICYGGCAF